MAKLKVKINAPQPSYDTIRKYKNFDSFLDGYKKYYTTRGIRQMLYHDRRKLAYIVIIILFLLMLLFAEEDGNAAIEKEKIEQVDERLSE
ncbi:MAG: hypothetical protein AAFX87_18370 [Bacteroidota bacterium]